MSSRTEPDRPGWRSPADIIDDVLAERPALVRRRGPDDANVEGPTVELPPMPELETWGQCTLVAALAPVYAVGGEPRAVRIVAGEPVAAQALVEAARTLELDVSTTVPSTDGRLAATGSGVVHPDDVMSDTRAAAGTVIVVTDDVGREAAPHATAWRARVTADAATMRAARRVGVRSATVLGAQGLLGAVHALMRGSRVSATLDAALVPVAADRTGSPTVEQDACLDQFRRVTTFADTATHLRHAMATPSVGGLLLSVDAPLAAAFLQALADEGVVGTVIGRITARSFAQGPSGRLVVQ